MRTLLALLFMVPVTLGAQTPQKPQKPGPQDVPQPVPGDVGLAGSARPDIARFLNVRTANNPTLSPDGARLSYLTTTTGQPQLWAVDARGGQPAQLTFLESSVTFQEWSPGGEWIAYGTDRGGNEREGFYLASPDGLRERELLAPSEAFRQWGGWSPDGRRVAFASTERNGTDFDVYVMDVAPDGAHGAPRRVLEGRGGVYVAAWRPDGAGFYVATNQDRDLAALAFWDARTRQLRWVETPQREVDEVALSRDGRYLAWTLNENGYSSLHLRDLTTRKTVSAAPPLPRGVYGIRFASRAPVLLVRVAGPQIPGDVWTLDARTGRTARATTSATGGLDPARFVAPEAHSFRSWDGETIHGVLYLPQGLPAGTKPPVLLGVHGGPTSQARPVYSAPFQYLLSRGIAVLDLNFRGSTGYGKRFTRLDNGRLRPNAVKDMGAALDWLATTGKVDASRAAVMGGSYGGYMTFAALTQLPERFRAGVGFVGVSNWVTALQGASPQLKASDRIEYGNIDDAEDRKFFTELSPITHVKNVRSPLMVLHGANDPRDPVTEADQLVAAIRAKGGEVEYLRFPDEGHG